MDGPSGSLRDRPRRKSADRQSAVWADVMVSSNLASAGVQPVSWRKRHQRVGIARFTPQPLNKEGASPRGLVDGFVKTCQRWQLEGPAQAILLGYRDNEVGAAYILQGRASPPTQDIRDRIAYILFISLTLGALLKEDAKNELIWMSTKRVELGGLSAIEVMLRGRMIDIIDIVKLVSHESGF